VQAIILVDTKSKKRYLEVEHVGGYEATVSMLWIAATLHAPSYAGRGSIGGYSVWQVQFFKQDQFVSKKFDKVRMKYDCFFRE